MDNGICKGCGAHILWVIMPSGKKMPLDPVPKKVIVMKEHQGHGETHILPAMVDGYTPHWATCPKAANFKRKKGEPDGS